MKSVALNDRVVDRLPVGTIVRDTKTPGLLVRVGQRTRAFRYEATYWLGDIRKTVSQPLGNRPDTSVDEARVAAARLHAEQKAGKVPVSRRTGVTLGQAAQEHFDGLGDTRWCTEAKRFYRKHLSHWENRSLASLSAAPDEVVTWFKRVTKESGPQAANHSARLLRAIYNRRLEGDRSLPAMLPTSGLKRQWNPVKRSDIAIPFDQLPKWSAEVDAVAATNPIRGAHNRLCVLLGLRPGELARLRREDVDLAGHEITLRRTKNKTDVTVPTSPEIEEQLKLAMDASEKLVEGTPWVFAAIKGKSGHVAHWREKEGLTWQGNSGRHTYRTVAASLGCDELNIRLLQGHALTGVSQGYITRALLTGTSLREWQLKISRKTTELMAASE